MIVMELLMLAVCALGNDRFLVHEGGEKHIPSRIV